MEKKQSSVEWLANRIDDIIMELYPSERQLMNDAIKQAKAMHKQEHEDAYIEGSKCKYDGWAWTLEGMKEMANEHYNETFSNETE